MTVRISSTLYTRLVDIAALAPDREVCGLLFGTPDQINDVQEMINTSKSLGDSFEIDPGQLIAAYRNARAGGPVPIGHFHSHPNGVLTPSDRDQAAAAGDGAIWLIIAEQKLAAWRSDAPGALQPVALDVAG